jgi:site-specific recombinase XerD
MSDQSIYSYGQSLSVFCHWLEREEIIETPVSKRFKLPRVENKFIPTYTADDVKKLLAACEITIPGKPLLSKALIARNRAIVSLFIDSGIRLNELVQLRLCDIDRRMHVLLVHRKGNKWQQIPVSRDGFKPLHHYLTKYRPVLAGTDVAHKEEPVFLADDGEPLTRWGVEMLFKSLKKRTGIEGKKVGPHNCRRYMATTQLRMGRSPLDVQRQMGHTSLTMTNRYASLTVDHLKHSHEKYSPLRAEDQSTDDTFNNGYWNA